MSPSSRFWFSLLALALNTFTADDTCPIDTGEDNVTKAMGCIKDYEEPQNAKSPETRLSTCKYWPECGRVPGINPPASHALAEHTKLARSAKISMTAIDRFSSD